MKRARKQKVIDKDELMNALDMLDEQYVTVDTVDGIIEDLEEDAMMASAEHGGGLIIMECRIWKCFNLLGL